MAIFRLHPAFGLILTGALALLLALGPAAPTPDRPARSAMIVRLGQGWIAAVQPSPDGKLVAVATSLGVELRESNSLGLVRFLGGRTEKALCVAFSPDGTTVASGSSNRTAYLWSTRTGELLKTLTGHTGEVRTVAFSPDGRLIATGSGDHTARLWDAQSGALVQTLAGHGDDVCSLVFSPSGELLATAGGFDGTVKLWRVSSGVELYTLRGHSESTLCVAFSPDGTTLASGSSDRTVKLWDVSTGAIIRTLSGQVVPETSVVSSVAFDSSGKYLAAAYHPKGSLRVEHVHMATGEHGGNHIRQHIVPGVSTRLNGGDVRDSREHLLVECARRQSGLLEARPHGRSDIRRRQPRGAGRRCVPRGDARLAPSLEPLGGNLGEPCVVPACRVVRP